MLKREPLAPPLETDPGAQQRGTVPTWVLVTFWLVVILLAATALALGVNYWLTRGSQVRAPENAAVQEAAAASTALPQTAAQPQRPKAAQPAGGVILVLTPVTAEAPTPAAGTPPPSEGGLPAEVLLQEVPIGKQTRALNCEFQTASDLAWYYGRPYTWEEIYQYVGHDAGGNPHKGFVGRSFDDRPGQLYPLGYGVYAEPIARAFAQLGLTAEVSYYNPREWLVSQLANGRPVMVWTTSNMTIRPVATWTAADGVTVKGVPGEHTYLAVGYDADGVWLIDPWDGQRRHFDWQAFLGSWDLFDRMALIVTGEPAPSTTPTAGP
jgi:uncharacterized protein YvpB